jgi:hypothetical protein
VACALGPVRSGPTILTWAACSPGRGDHPETPSNDKEATLADLRLASRTAGVFYIRERLGDPR